MRRMYELRLAKKGLKLLYKGLIRWGHHRALIRLGKKIRRKMRKNLDLSLEGAQVDVKFVKMKKKTKFNRPNPKVA